MYIGQYPIVVWCIMKVYQVSNIPNSQSKTENVTPLKFKGKSDWGKIGLEVSKKSKFLPKTLTYLGQNDGEILNTLVTAVGTSIVAPIFIAGNPFSKEDKETKWYSAMRQPISAIIALVFQLYINNVYNDHMAKMASNGALGEPYDLRAIPKASYLKKIIKLEHPEYNSEQIKAEIIHRQEVAERKVIAEQRNALKDKPVSIKDIVSKESLDDAKKKIVAELEEKYKEELTGKSSSAKDKFIKTKLNNSLIEERAIKELEQSLEAEAQSKFKVRELAKKYTNIDDAIKYLTETKVSNDAEKKLFENTIDRLEKMKIYEESKGMKAFSSIKDLGNTYEKVLHNVKIKRLVKAKAADAQIAFSKLNKWSGIIVSLVTLPFSCGLLNWAYPRVMEHLMPKLQPWIHRNDPDWTPEKAKKYGPPEKLEKVEQKQKVKVEIEVEEEDSDD